MRQPVATWLRQPLPLALPRLRLQQSAFTTRSATSSAALASNASNADKPEQLAECHQGKDLTDSGCRPMRSPTR